MAATLQPAAHQTSDANPSPSTAQAEMEKLDLLFEDYLTTLDKYQKTRQEISTHLSSGFLSLAQANFSQKGRRYGRDYYDERMQATKKVSIKPRSEEYSTIYDFSLKSTETNGESNEKAESNKSIGLDLHDGDHHGGEDSKNTDQAEAAKEVTEESEKSGYASHRSKDPIRWFGLFVPPALRSAQTSFTTAVEDLTPRLIALQQELRSLEIDIGRTRKAIKKLGKS